MHQTHWKPRPRILSKQDDARSRAAHKRRVNAEVDARDERRCRCCGRKGNPNATTALGRIHRAHIVDASRGGAYEAENLASLCWICHAWEHAKGLRFVGTDAGPKLRFVIDLDAVDDIFGNRVLPPYVSLSKE